MATPTAFTYHTELINGQEIEKPLGKKTHAYIQSVLMRLLFGLSELKDYLILPELNVLCNINHQDRIVPDIAIVPKKAQYRDGDLLDPPVLAIEIISPGQSFDDLLDKCERLCVSGTPTCWIMLPAKRQAWIYSSDGILRRSGVLHFDLPTAVIRLRVEDVFSALDD